MGGGSHPVQVDVANGRDTWVVASFPTPRLAGLIAVSQP
jgi:hypothetical protein